MTPHDHVALICARSDQILWLWVAYLAGAGGFLAFTLSAPRDRRTLLWFSGLFLFAAYTHLECMRWVVKQWHVLSTLFVRGPHYQGSVGEYKELLDGVIHAPNALWIIPFHVALDLAVLVAVWKLARRPLAAG